MMIYLFLILVALPLGSAKTLTVDASISLVSGTNYPSLQTAVAALYSGSTLVETTNTITLLPNTAGTTQTITTSLNGDSGTGSITIQFQSPPSTVDSTTVCSQLPVLSVIGTSILYANNLASLSLVGLYIKQKYTSGRSHELNNIGTVTLSSFCLDLTESSSASMPSTNYWLYFSYISQLTITNGYVAFDGTKELWVQWSSQVNVSSVTLDIVSYSKDSSRSIFQIYQDSPYNTNLGVTDLKITCPSNAIPIPNGVYSNMIYSAYYSNIQVANCDFSSASVQAASLIYSAETVSATMDSLKFTNIKIGDSDGQAFIGIVGNRNATISNVEITTLAAATVSAWNELIFIHNMWGSYYSPGIYLVVNNVSITNTIIGDNFYFLYLYIPGPSCIAGLVVNNFTADGGQMDEASYVIRVQIGPDWSDSTLATRKTLAINKLNVMNIRFMWCYVAHFDYPAYGVPAVEVFHVELNDNYIANNYVNASFFYYFTGMLGQIVNLTAVNQTVNALSTLIKSRDYVGSLFIVNSNFTNCTMTISSGLISFDGWMGVRWYSDFAKTRSYHIENSFQKNSTTMYTEARPFIVYNSTFSDLLALDTSIVIWSTNPQAIFQGNTLQNISLNNSRLLQLGSYMPYANIYAFFQYSVGYVYLPTTTWFDFFEEAETAALAGSSLIRSLFYDARNHTCSFDSQNCATFIYTKDNVIDQVNTVSSDYVMGLTNFQVPNSSVIVINNTFSRITGISTVDFPILLSDSINRAFIIGNLMTQIDILGYVFSLTSFSLDSFFFDSNIVSNTSKVGAYLLESYECNNITIQNMLIQNLQTETDFISMSCTFISTQIKLKNSTFENIIQQSNQGARQAVNFIYISTQNISSTKIGNVDFQDNTFSNITLARLGGYTTNTIGTSFILLFMTQSFAIIHNNTLNEITLPEGTIMTVSTPTLTVTGSTFQALSFGDAKGALNLIVQNFTLFNSSFSDSQSSNYIGSGLIQLTSPFSVSGSSVYANISNCSFTNNSASYGTILYATSLTIQFLMQGSFISNNLPSNNEGQIYFVNVSGSAINVMDSSFVSDQALKAASSYFVSIETSSQTYLTVANCSYEAAGNNSGGFLSAQLNPDLSVYISEFTFTASQVTSSGVPTASIMVADSINAYFTGVTVTNLTLGQSAIFAMNCDMSKSQSDNSWNLTIDQSSFDSLNLTGGIVTINSDEFLTNVLDNLTVSITNSNFSNIKLTGANSLVTATTSLIGNSQSDDFSIVVRNCSFSQIDAAATSAIFSSVESRYRNVLWIDDSDCQDITSNSTQGGGILNPSTIMLSEAVAVEAQPNDSTIKMTDNTFLRIQAYKGGIMTWTSLYHQIAVLIARNSFESISATQDGGIVYANYSVNEDSDMNQSVVFNITENSFKTINSQNGGIVQFEGTSANLYEINLNSNTFEDVKVTQNGGVVNYPKFSLGNYSSNASSSRRRVLSGETSAGKIVLANNQITTVTASNGAVVFEFALNQTLNLSLVGNTLNGLYAQGRGGLAYTNQPFLNIKDNTGTAVSAGVSGPVLFSMSDQLNLVNAENNFDGLQNSEALAFSPTNLHVKFVKISDSSILTLQNYESFTSNPTVPDLTSYSMSLYRIELTLIYAGMFGNQTVVDNSPSAILRLTFISPDPIYAPQNYITSECSNSKCVATPSNVILAGKAGDIYVVNATYQSNSFNQFQQFMIRLRACAPGELNQTQSGQCIFCPQGTYSLDADDQQCTECPEGVDCRGGGEIWIKPGYYRSENTSGLFVMPCNDSEARCLGGQNNSCIEGHTGPFCLQCLQSEGFVPEDGDCVDCEKSTHMVWGVLAIMGSLIYQIFLLVSEYKENKKLFQEKASAKAASMTTTGVPDNLIKPIKPGDMMVILTTFTQICSVVAILNPGFVSGLIGISLGIGNPNKQVLMSLKCLYYRKDMDPLSTIKLELLFYIFSPVAKLLVVLFFEFIRMIFKLFKEPKIRVITRLSAVAVVLILLEQPNIIGALSNYLTCEKLDPYLEDQFMTDPTTVQCYTPEYISFRNKAVIPALIIWGIGVPLVIFLILFKNRKILPDSETLNVIFGPLYNIYSEGAYYWGLVIIVCKMTIFTLNSVLTVPEITKCVIFLIVLQLYYELLKRNPPYPQRLLSRCEVYCVHAYRLTLIIVILKLSVAKEPFDVACDVLILITLALPGTYFVIWIAKLQFRAMRTKIKTFKEEIKRRKTLKFARTQQTYSDTMIASPSNHAILSATK